MRIGVVVSRFNSEVGDGLMHSCLPELLKLGVRETDVLIVSVPGALEIPLALQKLAQSGRFDALIALGAVIRGETYHFEIVAGESARALMGLTVDESIALGNGILTVENEAQAWVRARRTEKDKGGDAAHAALKMIEVKDRLSR
ncbi:MAG TPA: 6,7-dimethyl-8-ribityllumazine synthase [Pararhizobium sp.]|nr:6,7-dimethyl-8-ribityllumazine synthase [Pararhizobium sp.]